MDQSVNPHISDLVILFTLLNFFSLPLQNSSHLSECCHDTHRQEYSIICLLSRHYFFLDWTTFVNILYEIFVIAFPPSSSPTQPWFLCLIFEPGFKFSCLKKKSSCSVFIVLSPCTEAAVQRNPRVVKPPSNVRPLHKPDVIKGHQTARGPHPRHHLKDFATNAKVIRAEKTDGIPWLKSSEPRTPRSANREKRGSDRSRGRMREEGGGGGCFAFSFFFFLLQGRVVATYFSWVLAPNWMLIWVPELEAWGVWTWIWWVEISFRASRRFVFRRSSSSLLVSRFLELAVFVTSVLRPVDRLLFLLLFFP